MNDTIISPQVTGSAQMQGDLWSARARDYAELQEPFFFRCTRAYSAGLNSRNRDQASMLAAVLASPHRCFHKHLPTSPA